MLTRTNRRPMPVFAIQVFALQIFAALVALHLAGANFAMARGPERYFKQPESWYASDEGRRIADNILSFQSEVGGWPKNTDTVAKPFAGDRTKLESTFDNSATFDELRFLAKAFRATKDPKYATAFLKGFDYVLKAQYANGGWPQFYPPSPRTHYQRYITFNDNAMVRVLEFLREVYSDTQGDYALVDAARKQQAHAAFDKGIACILKCQIKVGDKLLGWCAQHDDVDFSPRPARTYELVSLSGSESVGIVQLLMSLENPSPEVCRAVDGAVAWLESAKIKGIRVERVRDPMSPKGTNKVVVQDENAPPMWARFYNIETNAPIFCDRDGVPKANLADIGYERRNGYNWLDNWPQKLLEKDYPAWKQKQRSRSTN
jgi:PelA/Pel-15E family pectate lyase